MNHKRPSALRRPPASILDDIARIFGAAAVQTPSYHYFPAGKDGLGREVRFAYSTRRDAEGYFQGWREVVSKNRYVKRGAFLKRRVKRRCKEIALRRRDAWRAKRASATDSGSVGLSPGVEDSGFQILNPHQATRECA